MREGYEQALVVAARDGDPRAVDRLVAGYLPLVYNVVGRALDGHADVDDVVQETMLRCVTGLQGLRDPASFRAWLVAIAVRQVRDRQADPYRARQAGHPGDPHDLTDPGADFAELTILRLELSGQRREVAEATRWLDPDDRELLSLWWLESSGELTRDELAQSLGLTNQHAAVRVQRMKERLDAARVLVRALHARPRCEELNGLVAGWSGRPDALWRKRLARHSRDCAHCGSSWTQLVAAERLLAGVGLVAPAAGLAAAMVTAAGGASAGAVVGAAAGAGWNGATSATGAAALPGATGTTATTAGKTAWLPKLLHGFVISKPIAAAAATVAVAAAAVVTFGVVRDDDAVPAAALLPPAVSGAPSPVSSADPAPTTAPPATPTARPTPKKTTAKPVVPLPPTRKTAKKGAAVWDFPAVNAGLKAVGASWYYNWGSNNDRMPASGVEFVPMIWGTANATDSTLAQAKRGSTSRTWRSRPT